MADFPRRNGRHGVNGIVGEEVYAERRRRSDRSSGVRIDNWRRSRLTRKTTKTRERGRGEAGNGEVMEAGGGRDRRRDEPRGAQRQRRSGLIAGAGSGLACGSG